jgi:hypothetical protein
MNSEVRQGGRARARTYERHRSPLVGTFGGLCLAAGGALAGLAVATRMQPLPHGALAKVDWVLRRLTLDTGDLLLTATAFALGGVVLLSLRSFVHLLGADRETAAALDELTRATTNQARAIEVLEELTAALRQETAEAHVVLRDQAAVIKHREENDPLFRMAASLDQLGARVDRGILDSRDVLLDELHEAVGKVQGFDGGPLADGVALVEVGLASVGDRLTLLERALREALEPLAPVSEVGHSGTASPHAGDEEGWNEPETAPVRRGWHPRDGETGFDISLDTDRAEATSSMDPEDDAVDGARAALVMRESDDFVAATSLAWTPPGLETLEDPQAGSLQTDDRSAVIAEPSPSVPPVAPQREPSVRIDPRSSSVLDVDLDGDGLPELRIEVELDRAFLDASEDLVPAPLPARRPEGLDLLTRLDSTRPIEYSHKDEAPPLFPDLAVGREPIREHGPSDGESGTEPCKQLTEPGLRLRLPQRDEDAE